MEKSTRRECLFRWAATALAMATCTCAEAGSTRVEQREVKGIDAVLWTAVGELHIEQTGRERLSVEAEPKVLAKIVTEVRQGRLVIAFAPGRVETEQPIVFRLQVKSLSALETRGAGEIRIAALSAPSLNLRLGGSDQVSIGQLEARSLDVRLEGSGELAIEGGSVDSQRIVLSGAGSYDAAGLGSREARVSLTGSGNVHLAASAKLAASISGSGDVLYVGRPSIEQSVSGAGSVGPFDR